MPSGKKRIWSSEDIGSILHDYSVNCLSTIKLGKKWKCDPKVIAKLLRKNEVTILTKPFKLNTAQTEELIKDYQDGVEINKIAEKNNIERTVVFDYLKRKGIERDRPLGSERKHVIDDDFFEVIDTEEKAYWLGFILADGCVMKGHCRNVNTIAIHLANKDVLHLEKLKKALKTDYQVMVNESNKYSVRLRMVSPKMIKDLAKYGVVERKTGKCYKPDGIPIELEKHFWRGCIDGDGGVSLITNGMKESGTIELHFCGDYKLVRSFRSFCNRFLYNLNKDDFAKLKKQEGSLHSFSLTSSNAIEIMKHLYGSCSVYLDRKLELVKQLTEFHKRRTSVV